MMILYSHYTCTIGVSIQLGIGSCGINGRRPSILVPKRKVLSGFKASLSKSKALFSNQELHFPSELFSSGVS